MDRRMKILLGVSLAVNLFLLGAAVAAGVLGTRMFHDRMRDRGPMMMRAAEALPEGERELLRRMMRERAVAAAPELRAAREARQEAARLIAVPDYDPAAVAAALMRARESEAKARSEIDAAVVAFLPKLDPQRRAALARALVSGRMGGGGGGRRERIILRDGRRDGPPPIGASSPP